ncbi:hypothetical protein E2C01_045382 [Portunus trituberculatus]|uniref:Uncharacterized protein n=1 Tax=Portunus trituberculatus TaxID=210409 RepID=A0A5B7G4X0_PORTR|nr:hypothetical protein [Portunus trituberculatus]
MLVSSVASREQKHIASPLTAPCVTPAPESILCPLLFEPTPLPPPSRPVSPHPADPLPRRPASRSDRYKAFIAILGMLMRCRLAFCKLCPLAVTTSIILTNND